MLNMFRWVVFTLSPANSANRQLSAKLELEAKPRLSSYIYKKRKNSAPSSLSLNFLVYFDEYTMVYHNGLLDEISGKKFTTRLEKSVIR